MDIKILIPLIRQIIPTTLAEQLVGVQPMSSSTGSAFSMNPLRDKFYVQSNTEIDGRMWYEVFVSNEILQWIRESFIQTQDYNIDENDYAHTILVSEEVFVMLKLKWV